MRNERILLDDARPNASSSTSQQSLTTTRQLLSVRRQRSGRRKPERKTHKCLCLSSVLFLGFAFGHVVNYLTEQALSDAFSATRSSPRHSDQDSFQQAPPLPKATGNSALDLHGGPPEPEQKPLKPTSPSHNATEDVPSSSNEAPREPLKNATSVTESDSAAVFTPQNYNFSSVRQDVIDWAQKWIHTADCEGDPTAIIARCCTDFVCGGLADRVRGLVLLTQVAEKANKRLCLPRDYFVPTGSPSCREGPYMLILSTSYHIYQSPMEPRIRPVTIPMKDKNDPISQNPGVHVRYISTVRNSRKKSLGISTSAAIKSFGMFAIALAGSLKSDMTMAQRRLSSCFRSSGLAGLPGVSLHVRCGRGSFTDQHGQRRQAPAGTWRDDEPESTVPDEILSALREIPADTVCQKPLYIATDWREYGAELRKALPRGMRSVTCARKVLHVGKSRLERGQDGMYEHLVDLVGLGTSDAIFKTTGGFAELASVAMGWSGVKAYGWPKRADGKNRNGTDWDFETRAVVFMENLMREMNCTHGSAE